MMPQQWLSYDVWEIKGVKKISAWYCIGINWYCDGLYSMATEFKLTQTKLATLHFINHINIYKKA